MKDTFKTIESPAEGLYKDKGSKFISYAYPVANEEEAKTFIANLKKEHHSARHHCYAWRLGVEKTTFRANDDGEPTSTAGKPILGQLKKSEVTNVLIVVVRYFGGTLLGTGGLINAYRSAAASALQHAKIITKIIVQKMQLDYSYNEMNEVMQIIKQNNLDILHTIFEQKCSLTFAARKLDAKRIYLLFSDLNGVKIKIIE